MHLPRLSPSAATPCAATSVFRAGGAKEGRGCLKARVLEMVGPGRGVWLPECDQH